MAAPPSRSLFTITMETGTMKPTYSEGSHWLLTRKMLPTQRMPRACHLLAEDRVSHVPTAADGGCRSHRATQPSVVWEKGQQVLGRWAGPRH